MVATGKGNINRRRGFFVVSIDVGHESLAPDKMPVSLHADAVFGATRVGGEAASRVRFRDDRPNPMQIAFASVQRNSRTCEPRACVSGSCLQAGVRTRNPSRD